MTFEVNVVYVCECVIIDLKQITFDDNLSTVISRIPTRNNSSLARRSHNILRKKAQHYIII